MSHLWTMSHVDQNPWLYREGVVPPKKHIQIVHHDNVIQIIYDIHNLIESKLPSTRKCNNKKSSSVPHASIIHHEIPMIFRLWGRNKNLWWNKSTKSMVQLDEFAITILLELAPRKTVGTCFLFKVTWKFGKTKNAMLFNGIWHGHIFSTFGTEIFVLFWDVFRLSQSFAFWKILETHIRKVPYLKSSNRNWQHFSQKKTDGYQDRNHVLFLTRRTSEN